MPMVIFLLIFRFVAEGVRVLVRKAREVKPHSLCVDCFHAHVQYAANARRAISCGYGGTMRPVNLDVLYCTGYGPRNLPARPRVIGFVREIEPAEGEDKHSLGCACHPFDWLVFRECVAMLEP